MKFKYNLKQSRPLIILMIGVLLGYILAGFILVPKIEEQRQEFYKEEFEDYIKIRDKRLKHLNIKQWKSFRVPLTGLSFSFFRPIPKIPDNTKTRNSYDVI